MSKTETISFRLLPHELKNISFYFICNVIDNIQPRADWDGEFNVVELTNKQKEDCLQSLFWFKNDIEACISHLNK